MSAAVPALLAAALVCAPGSSAARRLRVLVPAGTTRTSVVPPFRVLVVLGGAGLGLLLGGPAGAAAGAAAAEVVRRRRARARARAGATTAATELAEAVSRIVEELRSGAHPATALDGARADGPLAAQALAPAAAAARLGDDVPAALRRAAGARADLVAAELRRLAGAWSLADRHGAPLADLLSGTLADLRWRLAFEARVRARLAGPRATAGVLTALPVLGLGLGHLLGADPLGVLRGSLLGQVLLVVGSGLLLAGLLWSDRIATGPVTR
ncbi:secretion system protein [Pseudonocardia kujensis]|uniref:type II secretion system F family protein n=1 Tax=Pseudonocardia kujensis TaxID=1128675 RepID=UPI001E6467D0|nr:type II secretion system F family protein [Pseudonocardia kujensis]MCE0768347.1 secretion system protein [Pseudonocardia kujensis]